MEVIDEKPSVGRGGGGGGCWRGLGCRDEGVHPSNFVQQPLKKIISTNTKYFMTGSKGMCVGGLGHKWLVFYTSEIITHMVVTLQFTFPEVHFGLKRAAQILRNVYNCI